MASKKKVAAKPQVWNKGLEVGKRDGFTPAQVKRICGLLADLVSPGSEIRLSSRWALIPCCTDRTCSLLLLGKCSVAMVQSVPSLKLRARGESHRCDAPCPKYPQRRLQNGSPRPAKSVPIIYSPADALGSRPMSGRQLNRLFKLWVAEAGLDPTDYGVEFLCRTKALHILKGTGDLQTVRASGRCDNREHSEVSRSHNKGRPDHGLSSLRYLTVSVRANGVAQRLEFARPVMR